MFKEDDPKTFSGMDSWGKTYAIITDDKDEVNHLFMGFTLQEKDAAHIIMACNSHDRLMAENLALKDLIREVMASAGDSRGRDGRYISDIGSEGLDAIESVN